MKRKILLRTLLSTLAALFIVFGACIVVMYDKGEERTSEELREKTDIVASLIQSVEDCRKLSLFHDSNDMRITLLSIDGSVLYDSDISGSLENHLTRPEIEYASKGESRVVERYSESAGCRMSYYAVKGELADGVGVYIRLSSKSSAEFGYTLAILPFLIVALIVAIAVSVIITDRFSSDLAQKITEVGISLRSLNRGEYMPINADKSEPEFYSVLNEINELNKSTYEHIKSERELIRQKSDFFANASHELKTPVTVMMGFSELLLSKEGLDATSKKQVERIYAESKRLANLVNDMLNLSRLERHDESKETKQSVNLREVAGEVLGELSGVISEKHLTVSLLGEGQVMADPKRMFELIGNLCTNAVNYNKENGSLEVKIVAEDEKVTLSVTDSGIGIPKEHIPRLCERFYRVDSSRSKKTGGTGLGLAIVKHICVLYDAKLTIESEVDKGTRVSVVFC